MQANRTWIQSKQLRGGNVTTILAPIGDDLVGLRDCAELAAIRVEHLEPRERGLRLTLPRSMGWKAKRAKTFGSVMHAMSWRGVTQAQKREFQRSPRA